MSRLRAMVLACVAVTSEAGRAQSLPPVPSSPPWVTELEYDAEGNITRTVRGAGTLDLSTRLSYDPLSRVETIVDPSLATTRLQHDGRNRLLQVTDPRRLETRYERDAWGNITKLISPDTGVTEFSYNGAGDLVGSTDSRGVTGRFRHDWRHRPTLVQYSRAGQRDETTRMAYDEEGAAYGFSHGQLTSTSYPGGSSQYRYGPGRELETVTQRIEPGIGANAKALTLVTEYGYTLARRTSITYPSGRQLRITWDGGRIVAMSLAARAGGQEVPLISQLTWEPFGSAVRGWLWHTAAGTVAHERVHDLAGRMVRYPIGDIVRDLRYDEADRIIRFTHLARDGTPRPALDQSFSFDANDRLTGVSTATASWRIDHDANGNRTLLSLNGSASTYATDAASNRLQAVSNPAVSLQYDNAGNATQASGAGRNQTATYNLAGQLAALSMGDKTTAYTYDAAGLRVRKSSSAGGSSTVVFVYDPDGHLLGEYGHDGHALREYVWLEGIPVAMFMPDPANPGGAPQVFHIHTDHLDTPRMVLDANQRTRWRWLAEPFGTTAPETEPDGLGAFTFNLRFPGQYADAESGLFYNQQRYYSPEGGRYTQSDPIGLAGGINTYSYVSGNPVSKVDPTGLLEHFMLALNDQPISTLECGCRDSYPAFSGNPPYRNNPDATSQANIGPAPEGWYYIVDRPAGGVGGRVMSFLNGRDDWFALYRDDGAPDDNTVENGVIRREIRLHPKGPLGNSFGCVTLNNRPDYDRLRRRLLNTPTGIIPGTNIKYYGTILLYRPGIGGLW